MESLERQRGRAGGLARYARAIEVTLADLAKRQSVSRIWAKDAALWKSDPEHQKIVRNSLGWLMVMTTVRERAANLAKFAVEVDQAGLRHILLLRMGGSSLCADVFRLTFGVMKAAQAYGDFQSLQSRRRRVLRIHIAGPIEAGVRLVQEAMGEG